MPVFVGGLSVEAGGGWTPGERVRLPLLRDGDGARKTEVGI